MVRATASVVTSPTFADLKNATAPNRAGAIAAADLAPRTAVVQTYPVALRWRVLVSEAQHVSALPRPEEERPAPALRERGRVTPRGRRRCGAAAGAVPTARSTTARRRPWRKAMVVFDEPQQRYEPSALFPADQSLPPDQVNARPPYPQGRPNTLLPRRSCILAPLRPRQSGVTGGTRSRVRTGISAPSRPIEPVNAAETPPRCPL